MGARRLLTLAVWISIAACSPFSSAEDVAHTPDGGTASDASEAGTAPTPDGSVADASDLALASDRFERTVADGFGSADVGGAWQRELSGLTGLSVGEGAGKVLMQGMATTLVRLPAVRSLDVDERIKIASAFGQNASPYIALVARQRDVTTSYQCRARIFENGEVTLTLSRSNDTMITNAATNISLASDEPFDMRFAVIGNNPTRLRCKMWKSSTPEPAAWQLEVTDAATELQAPGDVGLRFYLGSSSPSTQLLVRVDDFVVRAPSP